MPDDRASAPATDTRALARQLARAARAEAAPWLHQEVARRMAERLPVIKQAPEHWLDWWGFTGGGAAAVAAVWPQARRSVAEPTEALAERSRAALQAPWWAWGQRRRASTQAAQTVSLSSQVPDGSAQMLWANLVLHSAADPAVLLARWHRALAVDGFLMFSTFGPDTLRELRAVYVDAGWPAPHPPYADMHDVGDTMVHAGFADPVMDQEPLQLTWSSPQALLDELRGLGGHLGLHRFAGCRTPRWRDRLLAALAERADAEGRIRMTFELVYGHAYKPQPKPGRGDPVTVSLEAVRATLPRRIR